MTDQNTQDLLDAIASQLVIARENFPHGIPVGAGATDQIPHIERIDYREGAQEIWLRLTNGEAWILRSHKLGDRVEGEFNVGYSDVQRSFKRYQALVVQWQVIERTLAAGGMPGEEVVNYLQAWHDDTLSDDERADYDRWVSGGYASGAEWAVVNA